MKSVMFASLASVVAAGADLPLTWNDCSDETYATKVNALTPDHVTIGSTTTITGTGHLLEDIAEDITFDGKLELSLENCVGSASEGKMCHFPLNTGTIGFKGIDFPVQAGEIPIEVDLQISKLLPADTLTAVAEITAVSASTGTVFCLEVYTKKSQDSHFGQGILDVTWSDCGGADAMVTVDTLTPSQIKQGQKTNFIGKGKLPTTIEKDDITFTMKLKVQLIDCNGPATKDKKCNLPLGLGYMEFKGIESPAKAGDIGISVDLKLSNAIPSAIVDSTTHVIAKTASGKNVFCLNVLTTPQAEAVEV